MAGEVVLRAASQAIRQLDESGTPYVLIGGVAIQAWGRIRSTLDVDLLLQVRPGSLPALVTAFREAGMVPRRDAPIAIGDCRVLQLDFEDEDAFLVVRIDLLIAGTPFHGEVVGRGLAVEIGGNSIRVATCEDLILLKLIAERPIDLVDAQELFKINRDDLDLDYLRRWAQNLGIEEQFSRATVP